MFSLSSYRHWTYLLVLIFLFIYLRWLRSSADAMAGLKHSYRYTQLANDEIRLFLLASGTWNSDLEGMLEIYRLPLREYASDGQPEVVQREDGRQAYMAPPYEALSYQWGEGDYVTSLNISENGGRNYHLPIKQNLKDALQQFRTEIPEYKFLPLWIDAICIDQGHAPELTIASRAMNKRFTDEEQKAMLEAEVEKRKEIKKAAELEKSAQIGKMADIYKEAANVRIWLGKESNTSETAMKFIRRLQELDGLDDLPKKPASDIEWNAFSELMQRQWFRRRWIVQEIAFASSATVHCGNSKPIDWPDFESAVSFFSIKYTDLSLLFQRSDNFAHNPDHLGEVDALGAKILVDTINTLFRRSEDREIVQIRLPLESLMATLTAFEASYPHDTVYAILRLSWDAFPSSKTSAASLPQFLRHHLSSPNISPPTSPAMSLSSSLVLERQTSQESQTLYRRPSRTETMSSEESQSEPAASAGHLVAIAEKSKNSRNRKERKKSTAQAAAARTAAEIDPETGSGENATPFTVDYEKDVFELCKDFVEHVIGRSRSLDFICIPWAPSPELDKPELPSWIQNVSGRPYGLKFVAGKKVYSRMEADPLVGTPGTGYQSYSASGKTRSYRGLHVPTGEHRTLISDRRLITCGFILDVIGHLEKEAINAIIPSSWRERGGWQDLSQSLPDGFWRTLMADRATDGPNPAPGYFKLACKWAFSRVEPRANLDVGGILRNFHGKCPSVVEMFLRRVQSVVWNRRLFSSEGIPGREDNTWLLGLAPGNAREGDLICILYGCSVPVILRKKPKNEKKKVKRSLTVPRRPKTRFAEPLQMQPIKRNSSLPPGETKQKSPLTHRQEISSLNRRDTAALTNDQETSPLNWRDTAMVSLQEDTTNTQNQESECFVTPIMGSPKTSTTSIMRSPSSLHSEESRSSTQSGATSVDEASGGGTSTPKPPATTVAATATASILSSEDKEYVLIGACYVHGMMDGDGFRRKIETGSKSQEFWLV